uniref:Bsp6I family restriction endonuclease n=1 Tax=Florenciella sp. virus SA2 TaxID=3240092 RepID=A0AB39JD90_9VIRU
MASLSKSTPIIDGKESTTPNDAGIMTDKYTFYILLRRLNMYINSLREIDNVNLSLSKKKLRYDNFPSDISENIVKFAIFKIYHVMPCWDTEKGDLVINKPKHYPFEQIEVKGFMSDGPSSFGPTECWDKIYFLDARDVLDATHVKTCRFKIYEINLSNKSDEWKKIIISGKEFSTENIPELPEPEELNNYNVPQLRNLCEQRALIKKGKKKELIDRLITETPGSKYTQPKTYENICKTGKRPRGDFYDTFKPQIGDEHCKLIFDGNITELDDTL